MPKRHPAARIALLTLVCVALLTTAASAATGTINATDVKFRRQADTSSEIIDLLGKGTRLEIVKKTGDWYQVRMGDVRGYVFSKYLTVKADAVTTAGTAAAAATPVAATVPAAAPESPSATAAATTAETAAAASSAATPAASPAASPAVSPAASPAASPEAAKEKTAEVDANSLNIRETASAESKKLGELVRGNAVVLLDKTGEWAKIRTTGGTTGYVLAKYLAAEGKAVSRGSESKADALIEAALSLKGVRYVHGGYSKKGTDCSGFVKMAFAKVGITTPRGSSAYASAGVKVSRANLQPGDVVCFDSDGSRVTNVSHVGIYLGNDLFIHASSTKGKVVVATFSTYQEKYLGARRFIR